MLVSAWSVQRGISLGQLATEEKSNEITAIPELLENIDIGGAIVTIDAAGCQKNIAAKIIGGGGDYILALKGNQGNLHQATVDWIMQQFENQFADVKVRRHQETLKGHGRLDTIEYYQFEVPDSLPGRSQWKGLRTIGMAIRTSRQGDKETVDVRYFISSLRLGVRRFAQAVRGHWAIENSLHWVLDMAFDEDRCRIRRRNAPDNFALLRKIAVNLLKREKTSKRGTEGKRKKAGWGQDYLLTVLNAAATDSDD